MKFKFVCNWNTDYNIYNIVNDIWNMDQKYELTYGDDYDYLIIYNRHNSGKIRVPRENVFGIILEAYLWSNFFDKDLPSICNKVYHYQPEKFEKYNNIIYSPIMGIHHLWDKPFEYREVQYKKDNTKNIINSEFVKNKKLSIIVSNHGDGPHHTAALYNKRHELVKKLLESDIDFDMYGLGWYISDKRYKGYITNKLDAIKNYEYTISLENTSSSGYVSEKFIDAILCNTIPIYNGHRDVFNYYPNSCEYIEYDDNIIDNIKNIINSNKTYKDYDIQNAKDIYLNKYNPICVIKNYIENEKINKL